MRTLDLQEAAKLPRINPEELRQRAKAGAIPGAKVGRRWVFVEDDLVDHVRSLYAPPRQALQVTLRKEIGMSLRKRGGIWWIDVTAPNGERIRRTTGTANKALAQEFHDRLKSELWRIWKLGEKPRRTWNEAAVRWLKEQAHKATSTRRSHQLALARSAPWRQVPGPPSAAP